MNNNQLIEKLRKNIYAMQNNFVASVIDFYDKYGFITTKQQKGLEQWDENIEKMNMKMQECVYDDIHLK